MSRSNDTLAEKGAIPDDEEINVFIDLSASEDRALQDISDRRKIAKKLLIKEILDKGIGGNQSFLSKKALRVRNPVTHLLGLPMSVLKRVNQLAEGNRVNRSVLIHHMIAHELRELKKATTGEPKTTADLLRLRAAAVRKARARLRGVEKVLGQRKPSPRKRAASAGRDR